MKEFFDKYLVNNWREAPKFISLWIFLLIGLSPELLQLAGQYDLIETEQMPALIQRLLNWAAFLGAAGRMIDQAAVVEGLSTLPPDDTDQAGA